MKTLFEFNVQIGSFAFYTYRITLAVCQQPFICFSFESDVFTIAIKTTLYILDFQICFIDVSRNG